MFRYVSLFFSFLKDVCCSSKEEKCKNVVWVFTGVSNKTHRRNEIVREKTRIPISVNTLFLLEKKLIHFINMIH